ncbi:MAG TPA: DNA-processing protein DprA [Victivallales bacterium]|nr:DNA-processing protein DprA [Victivallales bacterium]
MNNREACIIINLLSGIGNAKFNSMIEALGSPQNIFSASLSDLCNIKGIGKSLSEQIINWGKNVNLSKELNLSERGGVDLVTILDEKYPEQLKEIPDPPLCLYCRGELKCDFNRAIGVVGSRRLTTYGREIADSLSTQLSYAGWTVISGLAYGIDAVAHKAVVNAKGHTIAVLGGGLARLHPQSHAELAREIIDNGGCIISEFPMEFSPTRQSFPMRNRIISGLSKGILVIEAGTKSGALITAKFALEHNRQIFAVPGRINSPMSQGCNKLIKNGAKLVENIDDIIDEFEFLPGFTGELSIDDNNDSGFENKCTVMLTDCSEEEKLIINCIQNEEKSVDMISMETELPIWKLLAKLQQLTFKKIIKELPGKLYILKS